jgi:2-oxoisovalerate dehydrogenase E2 component (dihydrolipoyl transacylase)
MISTRTLLCLSGHTGPATGYNSLYEIETEKISQEVEATGDGVMVEHAVAEGSDVRVGELVCVVETASASETSAPG